MEEDSTVTHHENLLIHFWVMGPGHWCPLTSGQESLMEKVTQLTKSGNPPSSLEAFLKHQCSQTDAPCLVGWWPWHHKAS